MSDGAVDDVGLGGQHFDGDGNVGDGRKLNRPGRVVNPALEPRRRTGGLRLRIALVVDHLQGAVQFLLGDEQRGIDGQGFLELGDGLVQFALLAQFLTVVDDRGGSLETNALEGRAIAQFLGFKVVGLLEEIVGRHVLLASLRILTFGVQVLGFVGDGGERYNRDQQQQECRAHQASHSIILKR